METWVMGMRDDRTSATVAWQRLLYWRLTRQHFMAVGAYSGTTQRLELARGERSSVYLFLGRCEPRYGDLAIAHDPPIGGDFRVSPFDTGGVSSGLVKTTCVMRTQERCDLVVAWSFEPERYRERFIEWGTRAYDTSSQYSRGERPKFHAVSVIDVSPTSENTSHAWDWEGRVAAEQASCSYLAPVRLIIDTDRLRAYRTWLRDEKILGIDEYDSHMNFIARIRIDPMGRASAEVMNSLLEKEEQW